MRRFIYEDNGDLPKDFAEFYLFVEKLEKGWILISPEILLFPFIPYRFQCFKFGVKV